MELKDIKLYTIHCHWKDESESERMFRTVAVGRPDFLEEDRDYDEWTQEEEDFDCQIFFYYDNYAELNQHLKDGDETKEDFIVTKIINQ
jgi:hypothetical protein